MTLNPETNKPFVRESIRCPQCGSANVRREILRRINIGCVLVNALAFATFLEKPWRFARRCRDCGQRFVN
jgi:ribosomal protein S14